MHRINIYYYIILVETFGDVYEMCRTIGSHPIYERWSFDLETTQADTAIHSKSTATIYKNHPNGKRARAEPIRLSISV